MNRSFFLRTFFRSALAILEPQIYIVVQRLGAENISLLSGRLVLFSAPLAFFSRKHIIELEVAELKTVRL